MRDAHVGLNELVLSIVIFALQLITGFNTVASADVEHGALREVVLVAGSKAVVVALLLFRTSRETILFEVGVVAANREETVGDGHLGADVEAVALHAVSRNAAVRDECIKRRSFKEAVEVLAHGKDLGNAEVIVAAEEEDVGIRIELAGTLNRVGSIRAVLREFVSSNELGRAVFARQSDTSIALGAREVAFITVKVSSLLIAVGLEGVQAVTCRPANVGD